MKIKRTNIVSTPEGYVGVIVLQPMGHYCGYVGIPASHPWYNVEYGEEPGDGLYVHGGLTYSEIQYEGNGHYPTLDPKYDGLWFFGFDAAHVDDEPNPSLVLNCDDFTERQKALARSMMKFENEESLSPLALKERGFKDVDYIYQEILSLSEQLKLKEDGAGPL